MHGETVKLDRKVILTA